MTTEDFSNSFDTLLNSYALKPEFGDVASIHDIVLDEYEKSVFLTLAQEQLIKEMIGDYTNESLARLEEYKVIQLGLQSLISSSTLSLTQSDWFTSRGSAAYTAGSFSSEDILALLAEEAYTENATTKERKAFQVVPINYIEYSRLRSKPFGGPNKRQAWRVAGKLDSNTSSGTSLQGLQLIFPTGEVSKSHTYHYHYRYVAKPAPIILTALPDGITIDGISTVTDCQLPTSLHYTILEKAVLLAIQSRADKLQVARQAAQAQAQAQQRR